MKNSLSLVICLSSWIVFSMITGGCAIENDEPSNSRNGYIVCTSDADCVKGVCIESRPFSYCGIECAVDEDCISGGDEDGVILACYENRCVDEESIPTADETEEGR